MRQLASDGPFGSRLSKRTALLCALALTTSAVLLGLTRPAQAASTATRTGNPTLHAWIAGFQNYGARGSDPATTPQQDATNFDLIVDPIGQPDDATAALMDSLHQTNPNLKYLVYLNGCCYMGRDNYNYPESSYAHDASGNRMNSSAGAPLMNRRDATWRTRRATLCQAWINQFHFDGCFYDSFSFQWFSTGGKTPIDPLTKKPWTQSDYDQAGQDILAYVRQTVRTVTGGPIQIGINGLGNGKSYFGSGKAALLPNADYAMAETFFVTPTDAVTAYRSEADWKKDVDMVVDVGKRGRHFIGTVKSWTSGTQAQKDQLLRYVSASFLLGADPNVTAYLNFQNEHGLYGGSQYSSFWNSNIGTPTGPYAKIGNCYVRPFTRGKVVVNPTTSTCSYSLGGTYTDTTSGAKVTTAKLAVHTGDIYAF